jgi:hypothetical protein
MRLFIFGLGYTATAFASTMKNGAESIGGTARTDDRLAAIAAEGFTPFPFDGPGIDKALAEATHLLVSIPPGESGDPVLARHESDIAAAKRLEWIGYLSTVGVYGDYAGAWVSERTTPHPVQPRATERLRAEAAWTKLAGALKVPLGIFRLAGIYGPGRNALRHLAGGTAHRVTKPGQVFNRIHVDDIATTLTAAAARPAMRVYNLADDEPAPQEDVVTYAAGLMGVAPPPAVPFADADLSPMARTFYAGNRRVTNRRIKEELGVTLRYPNYRDGLTALWNEGNWRAP